MSINFVARVAARLAVISLLTLTMAAQSTPAPASNSSEQSASQDQNAQKPTEKDSRGPKPAAQQPANEPAIHEETTPPTLNPAGVPVPVSKQQPKRILGLMPNFRAVSAGALPPPPSPKQSFVIATKNSFDYSSFVFVGITSGLAELSEAHPALGENGLPAFGRYYWRGFLDKTDGNYLVIFAMPSILHQDERYYAMGEGPLLKRGIYSATRILITPNYHGHNTFNASEVLGRAMAQGISTTYYPKADRTAGALAVRFGWAMGRDALTNVFREFWPDIATHVFHRHP